MISTSTLLRRLFYFLIIVYTFDVYIKAIIGIEYSTYYTLYKDVIVLIFIVITTLVSRTNHSINIIDWLMLCLISFGLLEIGWTYIQSDNLILGLFRFRLYFVVYILYFFLRSVSRRADTFNKLTISFLYRLSWFCFLWSILEYFLINFKIVPIETIIELVSGAIRGITPHPYGYMTERGIGVLANMTISGVYYVVLLAFFYPHFIQEKKISQILFLIAGVIATVLSLSKTADALLLILLVSAVFRLKNTRFFSFFMALFLGSIVCFLYINYHAVSDTINSSIFTVMKKNYIPGILIFLDADILQWLVGYGYEFQNDPVGVISSSNSISIGSEVFIFALFKQFGILGTLLYCFLFVVFPFYYMKKNKDPFVKGACLAVLVAGCSSAHYNAIFRPGVNILVVLFLTIISNHLDVTRKKYKSLNETVTIRE